MRRKPDKYLEGHETDNNRGERRTENNDDHLLIGFDYSPAERLARPPQQLEF